MDHVLVSIFLAVIFIYLLRIIPTLTKFFLQILMSVKHMASVIRSAETSPVVTNAFVILVTPCKVINGPAKLMVRLVSIFYLVCCNFVWYAH